MISDTAALYRAEETERATMLGLGVPLLCIWLLGLATFTFPGRDGPSSVGSLDVIALTKVGSRAAVLLLLTVAIWRSRAQPRWLPVLYGVIPFGIFLIWAILSTAWSPLRTVSLGQAGSLVAQVMLATCLAMRWSGPQDTSTLLKHLCLLLLVVSATVVTVDLLAPQYSGMDRFAGGDGALGIVHPTSAGATASLGVIILLAARLLWNWRWTHWLIVPGILIHSYVLLVATSRTALALTMFFLLVVVAFLTSRLVFAAVVVVISIAVGGYLILDPALEAAGGAFDSTTTFLERGESGVQLTAFNGRAVLWEIVWNEFCRSPLRGWGYFVTSEAGVIEVWSFPGSNLTAHNVLLQVLASTGLIGGVLFVWALAVPFFRVLRSAASGVKARELVVFMFLLWAWYLGWGQLCSSFMGPIQPETVVFYSTMGLALTLGPALQPSAFEPQHPGLARSLAS